MSSEREEVGRRMERSFAFRIPVWEARRMGFGLRSREAGHAERASRKNESGLKREKETDDEGKGPPRLTMQPDLWPGRTYIELHTIS